jgi:hypothetical protein
MGTSDFFASDSKTLRKRKDDLGAWQKRQNGDNRIIAIAGRIEIRFAIVAVTRPR